MTNEAGAPGSQPPTPLIERPNLADPSPPVPDPTPTPLIEIPDLATPDQDLRLAAQAQVHGRRRGQAQQTARPNETLVIETEGKLIGRDRRPVPADDVFKLAAIGCRDHEIADWFGVDSNTLRYNFSVELLKGRETLKQSLRRKQIEVAMGGNAVMLIFLGKNLLGQSDSPVSTQEKLPLPWEEDTATTGQQ